MCVVKTLDIALKNVETILTGDLLCYSLPIFGFTPKHQEGLNTMKMLYDSKICWCGTQYRYIISLYRCANVHFSLTLLSVTVAHLLNDVKNEFSNIQVREALVTLNWLKLYCTEHVIAGPWNIGCLKLL